jgi:DNA phosphorothioation-dependent restriction protein DptF
MRSNPLLVELRKLRESSKYAVAQGTSSNLDKFKRYLHIERDVEIHLKDIIIGANELNTAQLILVCGNVGDGKSHILSYLHDELTGEISKFIVHNDATEAHNPKESSNETLYKLLDGFKDKNVAASNDKIILAINLGTLSKFIEEYGEEFQLLKTYIANNRILDNELINSDAFDAKSNFHHINFTDYHLYVLREKGPVSDIVLSLLEKIITDNEDNLIYSGYIDYKAICQDKIDCPILYNYEFLFEERNRVIISQLIIKAIIVYKEIVSVRTLLNFIYDIIVPVDLSILSDTDYFDVVEKMQAAEYIANLTPNYLFEHPELSSLFEKMENLDPCNSRNTSTDETLLTLVNTENTFHIFSNHISGKYLQNMENKLEKGKISALRLSRFFIRLNYFSNYFEKDYLKDRDYDEYLISLFHYNNHNITSLQNIYALVENAASNWNGDPKTSGKVIVNVGRKQTKYRIFKDFEAVPNIDFLPQKHDTVLHRFTQEFVISFKSTDEDKPLKIHVDFSLFKILKMISKGYRPNKKDNNNYVYFVSAINMLISQNNKQAPLYIDEVNVGKPVDYKFSKNAFSGFKFEVI